MKTRIKNLILCIVVLSMSSCLTLHNGVFYNSVQLNTDNFRYVKMNAEGSSTAIYILGFGGGIGQTLMADAKKELIRDNPLKSNQTLANTNVNYKISSYFGIVSTVTCTINADIVEFGKFSSRNTENITNMPTAVDSIPSGHIITIIYPKEATLFIDSQQAKGVPFVGFLTFGKHHLFLKQGDNKYKEDITIYEKANKKTFSIDFDN